MTHTHTWHDLTHDMSHDLHDLTGIRRAEPARQAFLMLWAFFVVAPIIVGLDKFAEVLTSWDGYLAPWLNDVLPGTAEQAMYTFGVIEIVAGLLVAITPRIGAYVVALWLVGIVVNLLTTGEYYDIAVRDVGLLVGALALGRLAASYHRESV